MKLKRTDAENYAMGKARFILTGTLTYTVVFIALLIAGEFLIPRLSIFGNEDPLRRIGMMTFISLIIGWILGAIAWRALCKRYLPLGQVK